MDWIQLAIPLIAVAVWIVSNLASQQKETRRPPRAPLPPPPRPRDPLDPLATGTKAKPAGDNKYREEMDRPREQKSSVPKPYVRPRPKRLEPASRLPSPPPVPAPVLKPVDRSRTPALDQAAKIEPLLIVPVSAEPIGKVGGPPAPAASAAPAAVKNLFQLLKTRHSLTTAFLLKEVLDLPLAKRARRRL
jgi:hypothetical protein